MNADDVMIARIVIIAWWMIARTEEVKCEMSMRRVLVLHFAIACVFDKDGDGSCVGRSGSEPS
jgi:hypothetical protein